MKDKIKKIVVLLKLILILFTMSGCWNYKEIEELSIVGGFAVDKGSTSKYKLTVEIIDPQSEKGGTIFKPTLVQAEGDTIFDAVRKMISTSGKKLYWSHAKVMIISEDIAKEGIVSIIDWVSRDSEVREDIWTLVTHGQPAYSIFDTPPKMESIISLQLNNTLRAEKSISRYPSIEMWKFIDNMSSEGISAVLPVVVSNVENGEKVLKVLGAGLFKKDRLIGYIDENMTKDLLWLRNELKGGLYNVKDENGNITTLEIHNSKTKLKPKIEDGQILINAGITINVDIAELSGSVNYIDENGRKKLENDAEKQIKSDVENTVKFIQKEYDADAFGFGSIIKIKNNSYWKKMSSEWDNIYPEIEVQVVPDVIIRGSATRKLPIKVGD